MKRILDAVEIQRLRKSLGMTPEEFARELGVSPSIVSSWENGRRRPSPLVGESMLKLKSRLHEINPKSHADEWWVSEVEQLRLELVRFARRRLTGISAEDTVADAVVELLETFRARKIEYPDAWFRQGRPQDHEVHAFRALVWTITKRRVYDELRRHYVRMQGGSALAGSTRTSLTQSPDAQIDARVFLTCLARRIDELPRADRELLAQAAEEKGARDRPLSGRDRVRLHRLRRGLAALMRKDLGS